MNHPPSLQLPRGFDPAPPARTDGTPPEESGRSVIDLRALWSAVYRNRWIVLAVLGACIMLGVLFTFLSTPIYRSTANVQIEQRGAQIVEGGEVEPTEGMQDSQRYLETQVDIIESRSLAREVAESLGLFNNDFLARMNIEEATVPVGSFDLAETRREQVLDALVNNLEVDLPVDSTIVAISFLSSDRVLAAAVANAYADNYISSSLERRFDTTSYARNFLEDQLRQTRQRLEESERELIDYARAAELIDANSGEENATGPTSLTTASLVQLNRAYSEATARRIDAEQRWREVANTPLLRTSVVLESPAVQELMRQRSELQAEYDRASERYGPTYVTQVELRRQIDTISEQMNTLARDLRDGIRQSYVVAQRQENAIESQLDQLRGVTLAEQDRSVRYNILRRQTDTGRTLYDELLKRYNEVSAAAGVTSNNISIIDRANPAVNPVRPRPLLNLAISIVAGLMLGVGLVYVREHFNDSVRSVEDIRERLGMPALGVIPRLKDEANFADEMRDRKSDMSEAYAALRGTLMLSGPDGAPRNIMFTSSGPGEGKSTSALAISRSFAQLGRNVLLIDADMRRPSQHRNFEVDNDVGLSSLLTSQAELTDAVVATDQTGLSLVPAGPIPVNPVELLASPGFAMLIDKCKSVYDMVIVDGPPVLGLADAPTLTSKIENTIFVIESNRIHTRQAREALTRLRAGETNILGVLLTKFDARQIGYYAADYGYHYSYGAKEA